MDIKIVQGACQSKSTPTLRKTSKCHLQRSQFESLIVLNFELKGLVTQCRRQLTLHMLQQKLDAGCRAFHKPALYLCNILSNNVTTTLQECLTNCYTGTLRSRNRSKNCQFNTTHRCKVPKCSL